LQLSQAVEDKDQLLARVEYQLAQLLRYRYGRNGSVSTLHAKIRRQIPLPVLPKSE